MNELVKNYDVDTRYPHASGIEHLQMLQNRSQLAEIETTLIHEDRHILAEADQRLLSHTSEFWTEIFRFREFQNLKPPKIVNMSFRPQGEIPTESACKQRSQGFLVVSPRNDMGGLFFWNYLTDLAEERRRFQPPPQHWWWYLDVLAQLPDLETREQTPEPATA